jgi:predicted MFS family arabinose efflux permease
VNGATTSATVQAGAAEPSALRRNAVIALMAFLTLVDLFATQAILPTLAAHYRVGAAAMGLAVNASTAGMAVAALIVGLFGSGWSRRLGVAASLAFLALPTAALAWAPDLAWFAALRVLQGLAMSTAFALTLSYLAEHCSAHASAAAFAAYISGNVASNLFGRLFSAALAERLGLVGNFEVFALLNAGGAVLAWFALQPGMAAAPVARAVSPRAAPWSELRHHLARPALRASFAIGFLILFAFIGIFSYVNFVLRESPIALAPMSLGFVYFVFLPALVLTPLAGRLAARFGVRRSFGVALAFALAGLPFLLWPALSAVLLGLVLVGAGTFFAQATATGFVGRNAAGHASSASGLYLASYFAGGLAGAAVVGQVFVKAGWPAAVLVVGAALVAALVLSRRLEEPAASFQPPLEERPS